MAKRVPWISSVVKRVELQHVVQQLHAFVAEYNVKRVLILTDTRTSRYCLSHLTPLSNTQEGGEITYLTLPAGEEGKTLESLQQVWERLVSHLFTPNDLVVCLGGGAVCDLGALASATYKRGIHLILIPTTILAACDASYGGKAAIDFGGVKNSIGVFYPADEIWICPSFWETLPAEEVFSGYGELLKYAILGGEEALKEFLSAPIGRTMKGQSNLCSTIRRAVGYKASVVERDPYDTFGERVMLNLGHTYAHAFEALYLQQGKTLAHGIAVAAGVVCELYLSYSQGCFSKESFLSVVYYVREEFPRVLFRCKDYELLCQLARQDKKNLANAIVCLSMDRDFHPYPIHLKTQSEWNAPLDFYREFMQV